MKGLKRVHGKINKLFNNEKEIQWLCPYETKTLRYWAGLEISTGIENASFKLCK